MYKYVNQDPSISRVRFHLNKLSGDFEAMHFRHEPSQTEMSKVSNYIGSETFEVTERLTD